MTNSHQQDQQSPLSSGARNHSRRNAKFLRSRRIPRQDIKYEAVAERLWKVLTGNGSLWSLKVQHITQLRGDAIAAIRLQG